jgi:PAS domain S-box-containing protein
MAPPPATDSTHAGFLTGRGEMATLIRGKDWSATALGPVSGWPQSLRTTVSLCLASNFPINIIWGPGHVQIYNDGYRVVCGDAHPRALGEDYSVTWASAWPAVGEPFERALAGETSYLENQRMFLTRNGYLEETFFTFSTSPILAEDGAIGGLFHPVTETTATMLAERRTRALRDLANAIEEIDAPTALPAAVVEVLRRFPFDIPFLLVYEAQGGGAYRLSSSYGVGTDDGLLDDLPDDLTAGAVRPGQVGVHEASVLPGLAASASRGPCGPYEEAPNRIFLLPLAVPGLARSPMVLVAGASPRLPFNDAYLDFVRMLASSLTGLLGTARALEDERRRAEALAAIDQAKTAFFSNVSHEFRTPLTLLLGPLEDVLAQSGALPAREREHLDLAHRNALRLLRLVNSLLEFSRAEAGRTSAVFEPVDLGAVTADVASVFRSVTERAGLRLEIAAARLPRPVDVDRSLWETILLNLLSNAFKFTFEGGIRVEVDAEPDGAGARVSVADTGTGIPETEIARLFDRFHRVEGARGRSFEGTGIGLALVHELVRLHRGRIDVSSEPGRGTTFTVHLPFSEKPQAAMPAGAAPRSSASRAGAFVEEAMRWLPDEAAEAGSPADAPDAADETGTVLLADDNADMRDYVARLLKGRGIAVVAVADGLQALRSARERTPDLILSDVMMPGMDGFELLDAVRADAGLRDTPVILLSARAGQEARVEGLAAGADDYLTKPFTARELVARVMANLKLNRARREAAAEVARSEARLRTVFESSYQLQWLLAPDGRVTDVNPTALAAAGLRRADAVGQRFWETPWFSATPGAPAQVREGLAEAAQRSSVQREMGLQVGAGGLRHFDFTFRAVRDGSDAVGALLAEAVDVTARKTAEAALRDAQKLEAIGRLTGGVAHDFNNLLMVVSGGADVLERDVAPAVRARALDGMRRAIDRGAGLTRQLLTFSRRTSFALETVDLRQRVEAMRSMLDRALSGQAVIKTHWPPGLWTVRTDASELELALLNLCVNARDAMSGGGSITIGAENVTRRDAGGDGPRDFVRLSVGDRGTGMSDQVLARIFEPFFTTKDIGKGSGLGLAQVHGFVQGCGGLVEVDSAEGRGTTVSLLLPRADAGADGLSEPAPPQAAAPRLPTVLLVEDDEDVAALVGEMLSHLGYRAVRAADARSALESLERGVRPDLVLSDIMMPGGMNGVELVREIRRRQPDTPVVLTTGYANAFRADIESDRIPLIEKPYSMGALAEILQGAMA